jgi:putative aldouronate transport system substrate-binding protein
MKRYLLVKLLAFCLVVVLVGSLSAGCGKKESGSGTQATAKDTTRADSDDSAGDDSGFSYPTKTDETLTYWWGDPALHKDYSHFSEQPFFKHYIERTGVNVEFIIPPAGQHGEAFTLLIASDDLPDIISYYWLNSFPGGPEKAISDGYIIPLNDYMEYAPNFFNYLKANPDVEKMVKTDGGNYYGFTFIRGNDWLTIWAGPCVRKDWLDDVGLPIPETVDDWYQMLKAFNEQKGASAPLTNFNWILWRTHFLFGTYGVASDFYQANGEVYYGPIEPGYKQALEVFHRWYSEGLIDPDIATATSDMSNQKMIIGESGAMIGSGGHIGELLSQMREVDPNADFIGVKYPVPNKGEKVKISQKDDRYFGGPTACITTQCKNIELAMRFCDYLYTEEGYMFANFGIEGETYTMVDECTWS